MGTAQSRRPELADIGRLTRRLVYQAVDAARTEDKPLRRLLLDHLGGDADGLPAVSGSWPPYEHVNLQAGLDAWLAGPGRRFELVGIAGAMRGMDYGIGLLIADPGGHGLGSGVAQRSRNGGGRLPGCGRWWPIWHSRSLHSAHVESVPRRGAPRLLGWARHSRGGRNWPTSGG